MTRVAALRPPLAWPLLAWLALALLGCAEPVQTRDYPRLAEGIEPIESVAIAPFVAAGALARQVEAAQREADADLPPLPSRVGYSAGDASTLVARYFSEALAERGLRVVPAEDLARTLAEHGDTGRLIAREVARVAHAEFGVDAVVLGSVSRFRERQGGVGGSAEPASVWFEVALYSAPAAERLWAGTFNQTQQPLSSNVLTTTQLPGGGTRWLDVEELGRWGAQQTARRMPLGHTLSPAEVR